MQITTYILDTFTSVPFKGNPTAVCLLTDEVNADKMLLIANELSLPVTAFITKSLQHNDQYSIRYFTSVTEIPACGHATLAAAKVAMMVTEEDNNQRQFITINNVVIDTECDDALVFLYYPQYNMQPYEVSESTLNGLGIGSYKTAGICEELETLFIELNDPKALRNVQPDYPMLVNSNNAIKEVVITSVSDTDEFDFLLRSFCPWIGIDEDPVTGSVHSVLAEFWQQRLGKSSMKVFQASPRGGEVFVEVLDDRVKLGGDTVMIMKGEISLLK
jgi:PhzF family phenazine biosynthesis protein